MYKSCVAISKNLAEIQCSICTLDFGKNLWNMLHPNLIFWRFEFNASLYIYPCWAIPLSACSHNSLKQCTIATDSIRSLPPGSGLILPIIDSITTCMFNTNRIDFNGQKSGREGIQIISAKNVISSWLINGQTTKNQCKILKSEYPPDLIVVHIFLFSFLLLLVVQKVWPKIWFTVRAWGLGGGGGGTRTLVVRPLKKHLFLYVLFPCRQ